jgi:hypothetical protein
MGVELRGTFGEEVSVEPLGYLHNGLQVRL